MKIRTVTGGFDFLPALFDKNKSVAVYNLSGKLLGNKTMRKNNVDLRRDFASQAAYML